MPAGAVMSPPDSKENSSEDEEEKIPRSRADIENLAELQAAIRIIGQRRAGSPNRSTDQENSSKRHLTLVMPQSKDENSVAVHVEQSTVNTIRKIAHGRANTESSVFLDLRENSHGSETPLTGSDEESFGDEDEPERSGRKPPMLRKKSGELVRPALRPSSARRRPSSMPGTPTFSKAVHFDSHLEHVRHFLQVDRPLAVSAGSSPAETYESETEFPFSEDGVRAPPFEWEIVLSNFPPETPIRLSLPVRVERVFLSSDNKTLVGSVAVANLAFNKYVVARFTLDYWKTTSEVIAEYNHDVRQPKRDGYDRFNFNIRLADQANLEAKTMFFCVRYSVNGQEHWDNNNSTNYQVDFRKKPKPQNGKKGMQPASSIPLASLPRSNKKAPPSKPKPMPVTYDDFADGFDPRFKGGDNYSQTVDDYLGNSTTVRLRQSQSAVTLSSDQMHRRLPQPHGQAFGNRYDFGASLSAAIQAANTTLGDRSGLTLKTPQKKPQFISDAVQTSSPLTTTNNHSTNNGSTSRQLTSNHSNSHNSRQVSNKTTPAPKPTTQVHAKGTDSPRPSGTEKPVLASQSYNELLDKYCFFGSVKSSPILKEGTMRSGQYDGSNEDGYITGSVDSTADSSADSSPLMMEKKSPPHTQNTSTKATRSASPAPMTGFVSGTSPMYHNLHTGFPFHDTHAATAIRG